MTEGPLGERKPGKIVTFYSYKGGTGRSMALVNVGWILASAGYRVLLVDWDLEAPGLHRYLHPFLSDPELHDSPGLIDWATDVVAASTTPRVAEPPQSTARLWDTATGLELRTLQDHTNAVLSRGEPCR